MRIDAISFTKRGAETAWRVKEGLEKQELNTCVKCWTTKKELPADLGELVSQGLSPWTEEAFARADALLFVGASGIAVRAIAPYIKSKETDPAVVVVDELGIHAISLLSGHIGGGNELTRSVAQILSARAVITTATDINGLFAVDQWAAERNLWISDMKLAKEVAASQLEGKKVGFYSDVPVEGPLPDGLTRDTANGVSLGIAVTCHRDRKPFEKTLYLVPKAVTLGMGCRRDIAEEKVEALIKVALESAGVFEQAVEQIASIDLKAQETALIAASEKRGIRFQTYTSQELAEMEGEFSPSPFVQSVTGVDNVCERAAIRGSLRGSLILKKQAKEGVTAALALRDIKLEF